jgi:hypothetical protein
MPLTDLKPDKNNARKHTPRNVAMIEDSIQRNGFGRSVLLASDGTIIAGNATVDAAVSAGLDDLMVIESDGSKVIAIKRTDVDPGSTEFYNLAISDNRAAELASWDGAILASLSETVELDAFFTGEELAHVIPNDFDLSDMPEHDDEGEDSGDAAFGPDKEARSDGSLLSLVDVTMRDPTHVVTRGDHWKMGPHTLVCLDVVSEWERWLPALTPGDLFCPYPGPFVALTSRASQVRMVLVQPSTYICGHMLDRYADVHGEDTVSRD